MNVPMKPTLIGTLAAKYNMDPDLFYKTIRATVMPGNATHEQAAAMLMVAHEYGLNPLLKQIYAFPSKGGGITPMISIDGWCELLNRQPQYDGVHFEDHLDSEGAVYAITCTMHRKDRNHPTVVTEYLDECKRATDAWRQSPKRMLRHRALIQAARYSFGLSGAFDPDHAEIEIAGNVVDVNYEPIERAITPVAPPAKRTAPSPGHVKMPVSEKIAREEKADKRGPIERELDAEQQGGWTLEELDDAMASAATRDELDTIYNDHDVEGRFDRDPASLDRAQDNYLRHVKRIDG
jgi:phage recombination protein Bet